MNENSIRAAETVMTRPASLRTGRNTSFGSSKKITLTIRR